jgi:hypothetical protein
MTTRKGWPRPGTRERERLDWLYWGDEPLGPSYEVPALKSSYYLPRLINSTGSGLATFRDAGDQLSNRLSTFVHWWAEWRRKGASVKARRKKRTVRVATHGSGGWHPQPNPIAAWQDRTDWQDLPEPHRRRGVPHGPDRDHRNPRPR